MEEKKTYSIIGKVEIGTDEYRDLIERAMEAEKKPIDAGLITGESRARIPSFRKNSILSLQN